MRYTVSNDRISISVDTHGAELKSLVKNGREYMWQADPAFWGRTAPVLFPMVGSLKNKSMRVDGVTYTMGQHGFARDMEFELCGQTENSLEFVLKDNAETRMKFPYAFELKIRYTLDGNTVRTEWIVSNPAAEDLVFSIGGHPAFNCVQDRDAFRLYDKAGKLLSRLKYYLLNENGLVSDRISYSEDLRGEGLLEIHPELFDNDALICTDADVGCVALTDETGKDYLKVHFDEACSIFGLWSPAGKEAPFVCIEPWYGTADFADATGVWEEKRYVMRLGSGKEFAGGYTIEV